MTFTDVHEDTRRLIARERGGDRAARELVAQRALRVGLDQEHDLRWPIIAFEPWAQDVLEALLRERDSRS